MRQTKHAIHICEQLIANKDWYHQRFDGAPMFIFAIADAEMRKEKRKPAGTDPTVRVCFFSHGKADWYLEMGDIRRGADVIMKLAAKDPTISTKLRRAWRADEVEFAQFFRHFSAINLSGLSKDQLVQLWKQYYELVTKCLSSAAIIDHFALGTDELIHKTISREMQVKRSGGTLETSEVSHVFSSLTAPVRQSFMTQAEIALLQIAARKSDETLWEYQSRYFWIKNNYLTSRSVSVQEFKEQINLWRTSRKDLAAEIEKIVNIPEVNRLQKRKILENYSFSPLLRTLLKISEDFTAWQDDRKRATCLNAYLGSTLLGEINKRTEYPIELLKYATGFEIEDLMSGNGLTAAELEARMAGSVFVAASGKHYLATGREVERLKKLVVTEKQNSKIRSFKGLTASLGRVQGRAKIITSVDEVSKVTDGDILVAVMTRPDYLPAMRKAIAIVTNEGGITSHAAVLSRELGIPCVIGTKIATKILKDGDFIEVDANCSTVTIL